MHITTSEPRRVPESSCPGSRLLKPAVRSMVALKNPDNSRSFGFEVAKSSWVFPLRQRHEDGAGDQQHYRHADGQLGVQAPSARPAAAAAARTGPGTRCLRG